jgi:hypothetical protein
MELTPQLDPIISKYLSTPQGRAELAKAMSQPRRAPRDYITCPECEALIILEPGSRNHMKHPENGCETGILMGVMES